MKRALVICVAAWSFGRPADAFDAATTHAGLTEGAALASSLGRHLLAQHGKPNGVWETLALRLEGPRGERIRRHLARLDRAGGYAPHVGRLPALEWLVAGSVIEDVPGDGARNHFYDPATGRGLARGGLLAGLGLRIAGVSDGGSMRGVFTGASYDGTGRASLDWLSDEENDLSLNRFLDARERAVRAVKPEQRDAALAESLVVAGGLLHVIEDAGDPARVRNDPLAVDPRADGGGDRLARFAAERYGRIAVPAPAGGPEPLRHLADAIHGRDGGGEGAGLADRTARRFFSDGTLPDAVEAARRAEPAIATPASSASAGYLAAPGVPHLVRWERDRGRMRYQLDERCLADYAAVVLPDAGRAALSALEHLFRGELRIEGGAVVSGDLGLGAGRIELFADDEKGARRAVGGAAVRSATAGDRLIELPAGLESAHVAAVFRGVDSHGEPIVIALDPPARAP